MRGKGKGPVSISQFQEPGTGGHGLLRTPLLPHTAPEAHKPGHALRKDDFKIKLQVISIIFPYFIISN